MLFVNHEYPKVCEQTHVFLPSKDYLNLRLTGETDAFVRLYRANKSIYRRLNRI